MCFFYTTGLYVLAVEIWAINIRNSSIKGTELPKLKDFHLEWVGKLANLEKRNGRIYQDGGFLIWQTVFGGLTSIIALKM